ncbi:MAG TPA: bifunctional glutamate N-acetyltransferase/amino-acid acetyltransferase ArgJ [Melioribacteraceae bacterium]|nr:bifunctional glutamate N-acetyltransferase/amino-acid acetyltransferase ArgJ [Melioribacteraceae bacterium]
MINFIENGSITTTPGFKAAGIFAGIKRKRKDLALIYSPRPCNVAGTFTINKVKAAPLLLSQEVIKQNGKVKAILVNSGNANACTGEEGYNDVVLSQKYCAKLLNINPNEVLVSSTGVIGQRMPMETLLSGIDKIVTEVTEDGGINAAEAIMTTDKIQKNFAVTTKINNSIITIGAICKGSGMIMPNMATMLAFITTDVKIENELLKKLLVKAVNNTFNKISVDGETSTNDMVVIMANGLSNIEIKENDYSIGAFYDALFLLCTEMAKTIAKDGEGATKLITVNITGADTQKDADLAGKSIANSSLVKTAIYGNDANWGRIMSSLGMSGAEVKPEKVSVYFDNLPILLPGYKVVLDEEKAFKCLNKNEVLINVNLNGGNYSSTWFTCDFTENYIKINAEYRS